jgi:hypothetical protein
MQRSWVSVSVVIPSCVFGAMPSARASSVTVGAFDVPGATETYASGPGHPGYREPACHVPDLAHANRRRQLNTRTNDSTRGWG